MGCSSSKDSHAPKLVKPAAVAGQTPCGPWLKSAEDLTDFPVWPAEYQQSLTCKFVTKEVWEEYKDKKDDCGVSFKTCIISGAQNVDSGIGCYAGSHSSYKTFNKFFDQVIDAYHKHPSTAKHTSNMNASELQCPPLPEDEQAMIVSTRIRVGRNLAGYPLAPGISNEQRNEIMTKVVEACKTFEGDLAGTFYSLNSLSKKEREQLIADHFLFK